MERFDVVVIGGGHAGCEAAQAAARMGCGVALVTLRPDDLGTLSCNPAIGGLGKGHLVREIDALDGVMGRVADAAGIQFRLLNRRKGPAVQGPRAQVDRTLYRAAMAAEFARGPRVRIVTGEVVDVALDGAGAVAGVSLADGMRLDARTVIVTTGTFLGGMMHVGSETVVGGRIGGAASVRLRDRLREHVGAFGRLKTGTPPRLRRSSIAWDRLERQVGDDDPTLFSFLSDRPAARQVACRITHTNARTHDIIRTNLDRSAMYGGRIEGTGPRYCPSIEDKVVRFADKGSHQIFLEPEGLDADVVYPNGISTSLPRDVQTEYVRSIDGLQTAEIVQPGYAVEYDFVDPRVLDRSLMLPSLPGLYLAGQINGTTGYEEAAAQGLVAGIAAGRRVRDLAPVTFTRDTSYIGVLVDDLVTRGVSEPYRMFTSRAEYRLSLRADNADGRLTPLGIELGLVGPDRRRRFGEKMAGLGRVREMLAATTVSRSQIELCGAAVRADGRQRTALEVLGLPDVDAGRLVATIEGIAEANFVHVVQLQREQQYAPYLERQDAEIVALRRNEATVIPAGFDYGVIGSLSNELREKLRAASPETLAQASRIEGMTPAALTSLLAALRMRTRRYA